MARFEAVPGLDDLVARMVAPEVTNVAKNVERLAKAYAPPVKKWVSMQDDRVRDTHIEANGQMRPDNLRFSLTSRPYDVSHHGALGVDYLVKPNDHTHGLPGDAAQFIRGNTPFGCRCQVVLLPTLISSRIKRQATRVVGSTVTVRIVSHSPNPDVSVVKAEYGDAYPTLRGFQHAPGTRYMRRAIRDTAAAMP